MTTLAIMKARIASELRRSDLTSEIAAAIPSAVQAYEQQRLSFSETRSLTFSTVANQEFYSSSDSALIPRLRRIDYVKLTVSNYPIPLLPETPACIETRNYNGTQVGQPTLYCYHAERLRLSYVPNEVWTVRVGGIVAVAAPASDSEADNPWMITAERLIRSRAKLEIALHVMRNPKLADDMALAVEEAFTQLKDHANALQGGEWEMESSGW